MDPKHPHSTMDPKRNAALNTARTNMEMAQGISRGVPPSNPQIATVLEGTERALNSATLPPESKKVGHDAAVLVGDMKTVFLEKNKDENLQGLIKDMSALAGASAHQVSAKAGPGGVGGLATRAKGLIRGQEAQGSMQQGMESVKQLVRALVRNDEFRSGLKELFSTLQWAFYQRSKDVRANVDQHWGSDQFYTYYSTPAFAAPAAPFASAFPVVGTTGTTMGTIPATSTLPVVTPIATIAQPVQPAIIHKAPDPMLPHPPRQPTTDFERKLANLTPMTNAERMELRGRLLTSLLKLNRTQELRNAMTNFVQLITWIKSQSLLAGSGSGSSASAMAKTVLPSTGPGIVKPATTHTTQQTTMTPLAKTTTTTTTTTGAPIVHTASTPTFKSVMKRFQRLVEEFSGAKSLDDLVFYTKEFFVMMKNDENLRNIMSESANWGHDFFKSGYTTQEAIPVAQMQQLDALIQRIDHTFVGLANHYVIWRLLEEIQQVTTAIKNDPFRQKLALDTKVLVEDFLYYDQMGRPQLNTQVISQLKFLILPILREQMAFIPLPRIEGSDEKMDYWIENVVLTTSDILPDNVKVDVRSKSLLNRPGLTGNMKNLIRLTLDNVRVHLKDVRFWYRKKTFPKMTDEGFVDFYLTRNGLRVTLELLTDFAAERDIFFVNKVKVNADRLKVKIHESKHDFLYSILLGLFSGRMKREIEFKTEEAIRNNFAKINTSLSRIVHAVGERRSAATGVLGAKTSGPIASALDTFVHPSVTRPSVTH